MNLAEGGHLTHGSPVNASGILYNFVSYGLDENEELDYDALERLAKEHKPKLIVGGASAYSLKIDFERMGRIAVEMGDFFRLVLPTMAGWLLAGLYPTPMPPRFSVGVSAYSWKLDLRGWAALHVKMVHSLWWILPTMRGWLLAGLIPTPCPMLTL